jgi:uncharacterized protein (DUF2237 family)
MMNTLPEQEEASNVFGQPLVACCMDPITGFWRDGHCNTGPADAGVHTVCVIVTDDFLAYSKEVGNDLSTPMPEYGFQGLKHGDAWCLCASRWVDAYHHGKAPRVKLDATHQKMLDYVPLAVLQEFSL